MAVCAVQTNCVKSPKPGVLSGPTAAFDSEDTTWISVWLPINEADEAAIWICLQEKDRTDVFEIPFLSSKMSANICEGIQMRCCASSPFLSLLSMRKPNYSVGLTFINAPITVSMPHLLLPAYFTVARPKSTVKCSSAVGIWGFCHSWLAPLLVVMFLRIHLLTSYCMSP